MEKRFEKVKQNTERNKTKKIRGMIIDTEGGQQRAVYK